MQSFEQFKEAIKASVKETDACTKGYAQLLKAKDYNDLARIVKESFEWCIENKVLTADIIHTYMKECNKAGIYCNQDVISGFCLVTNGSEIDAYGHSFVYVIGDGIVNAYDSTVVIATDDAVVKCWDMTTVTAKGNVAVYARDFSEVKALDKATISANDNSYILKGSDSVNINQYDNSIIVNYAE